MARKETVVVTYTDDFTGEEVPEEELVTVQFSVGGHAYSIDLSKESAEKFDSIMNPFVQAARLAPRNVKGTPRKVSQTDMRDNLNAIRSWARENGYEVSDRGRVAQTIVKAYADAH